MGLSIDATVAYGVAYDPEEDDLGWMEDFLDEEEDFDFDRIIARHAGIEPLDYSDYPGNPDWTRDPNENLRRRAEHETAIATWRALHDTDDYYARKREVIAACPLDLDYAGSGDSEISVYVVHVRGYKFQSYWSPEPLPTSLLIPSDKVAEAMVFAQEIGIPWANPTWLLYPYYSH